MNTPLSDELYKCIREFKMEQGVDNVAMSLPPREFKWLQQEQNQYNTIRKKIRFYLGWIRAKLKGKGTPVIFLGNTPVCRNTAIETPIVYKVSKRSKDVYDALQESHRTSLANRKYE